MDAYRPLKEARAFSNKLQILPLISLTEPSFAAVETALLEEEAAADGAEFVQPIVAAMKLQVEQ